MKGIKLLGIVGLTFACLIMFVACQNNNNDEKNQTKEFSNDNVMNSKEVIEANKK